MMNLFQSNDSVYDILREAGLQRVNSDDRTLFQSTPHVIDCQRPDDARDDTSEEQPSHKNVAAPLRSSSSGTDNTGNKFMQSMLDILAIQPVDSSDRQETPRNTASESAHCGSSSREPTSDKVIQEPSSRTTPSRSSSGNNDFMQSMLAILSTSPPSGRVTTRSTTATGNKRPLPSVAAVTELTNSKTWNNLDQYHGDVNVDEIFQSKQDVDREAVEPQTAMAKSSKLPLVELNFCEPTPDDVLLGRGGRTNNHPGNKKYLTLKDRMQHEYLEANKTTKNRLSQELVRVVQADWGGRFLKMDSVTRRWYEIDDESARKKCSQSLREINTPEVRAAKRARYGK